MAQYSAFSTEVRCALIKRGWTFSDLASAVREKTGLFCDGPYLSRILAEQRNPPKVISAIRELLDIPEAKEDDHEQGT